MKKSNSLIILILSSLLFANHIYSQVVINEIMVNPAGTNDGSNMPNTSEWVELFNPTASAINMSCWYFTDGDFAVTFPSGASIPAYGYYTIASASGSGLSPNLDWATCGCTSNNPGANGSLSGNQVGIFTNGAEQVLLYDNSNTIQDAIIWGGGQLTSALTLTITAVGSCGAKTITIPSSTASYENIGTNSDGIAKERQDDASLTWQNTSSPTFGTANSAIILADDFIDFELQIWDENIELSWMTVNVLDNAVYYVEKSFDGTNFNLLDINVIRQANSFLAIDKSSERTVYYRIKKIDNNGYFSYSTVLSASQENDNSIVVFPNPSTNGILAINLLSNVNATITISDLNGRILYTANDINGLNQLDITALQKGMYILAVTTKIKTEYIKLVVE